MASSPTTKRCSLAKEMAVLEQTKLTLVIAKGEGHNPIRAVGVLLCHMNHICRMTTANRAQIWKLRVTQKNHESPREYLEKIATAAQDHGQSVGREPQSARARLHSVASLIVSTPLRRSARTERRRTADSDAKQAAQLSLSPHGTSRVVTQRPVEP
jgi:hypothetical protein